MPWMSIAVWLVSFLISSSRKGVSTGKAALIASGAALATYYTVDPANPDRLFDINFGNKVTTGDPTDTIPPDSTTTVQADANSTIGGALGAATHEVGATLRSWGPTGTLAAVGGVAALTGGLNWKWLAAGAAGLLILSR